MQDEECTTTEEKQCTNLNEQKGVLKRGANIQYSGLSFENDCQW